MMIMPPPRRKGETTAQLLHILEKAQAAQQADHPDPSKIAEVLVAMLTPALIDTIAKAVQQGIMQIKQEMIDHATRITDTEQRVSALEDDHTYLMAVTQKLEQKHQDLIEKIEDLENRSRRNNIRVVSMPENYGTNALLDLCECKIPQALGLKKVHCGTCS